MAAPTRRSPARRTGRAAPQSLEPARPAPPLSAHEAAALVEGRHHDPHAVLGAHPVPGGTAIRVLRPHAQRVVAVVDGAGYELTAQSDGFFAGIVPVDEVVPYALRVTAGEVEHEEQD